MTLKLPLNIAAVWRRIALLAAAIAIFSAPAATKVHALSIRQERDENAAKTRKHQEKAAKEQRKRDEKQRQKQQRPRGDRRQIADYERANFKQYRPLAGERIVRIPDAKFHQDFGRDHHFRMARPVTTKGFPRFQYRGFSFVLEEPWPEYWYDDDDYYILEEHGSYYLYDLEDPEIRVSLVVVNSAF